MRYLTAQASADEILGDPILKDIMPILRKFAGSDATVDLFDKRTWGGDDYQPLHRIVHGVISIHASQNQGVENYVQSAAIVRQSNVKEARASARVLLHSFIIKRFN